MYILGVLLIIHESLFEMDAVKIAVCFLGWMLLNLFFCYWWLEFLITGFFIKIYRGNNYAEKNTICPAGYARYQYTCTLS
jgi:hypothetical protein